MLPLTLPLTSYKKRLKLQFKRTIMFKIRIYKYNGCWLWRTERCPHGIISWPSKQDMDKTDEFILRLNKKEKHGAEKRSR
jgi:hypothetical protein